MTAMRWDSETLHADIVVGADGIQSDDGLDAAVILSLGTNARAPEGVKLPSGADRGGWWADAFIPPGEGIKGSLLWTLQGSGRTDKTLRKAEEYAKQALGWMVEDGAASAIEVTASWAGEALALSGQITGPTDQGSPWQRTWRLRYGI